MEIIYLNIILSDPSFTDVKHPRFNQLYKRNVTRNYVDSPFKFNLLFSIVFVYTVHSVQCTDYLCTVYRLLFINPSF